MPGTILALNAGSSSLKFGLFRSAGQGGVATIARGHIEAEAEAIRLKAEDAQGRALPERAWHGAPGYDSRVERLVEWAEEASSPSTLRAVGHRIVHGGSGLVSPVLTTSGVIEKIEGLTPLAPLHQPLGLFPIRRLRERRPDMPQVCCFDTAFHAHLQPPVSRYAVPRRLEAAGVRRYGFHGLSYEYIAGRLAEISPELAAKRTVVAHLGNGASLCAMQHGRSRDTTMGFSALDGLVMGTRPGSIDPGVLIYLQQSRGTSLEELIHLLYHECGLLGVSGISGDMRTLLASPGPAAAEAVELFTFRAARETAALASTLEGLECFVFTGGIGEHSWQIREMIAARLSWLGMAVDQSRNRAGAERIDAANSEVEVYVLRTDEETVIARQAAALLDRASA